MARSARQKAAERALREANRLLTEYEHQDVVLGMTSGLTARNQAWREHLAMYLRPTKSVGAR